MVTLKDIYRSVNNTLRHATAESDGQDTIDLIEQYLADHNGASATATGGSAASSGNSEPKATLSSTTTAGSAAGGITATPPSNEVDKFSTDLLMLGTTLFSEHQVSCHPDALRIQNQQALLVRFVRLLLPVLGTLRIFRDWWEPALKPILRTASYTETVKKEAREIVAGALIMQQEKQRTYFYAAQKIVEEYLAWSESCQKRELDEDKKNQTAALLQLEQDEWSKNLVGVLLSYGAADTKPFYTLLNKYFLSSKHRLQIVYLLSEFLLRKRTRLHEILETDLFNSMLKSLMYDNSTTLIALSVTNLIMLLPRICNALPPYLPQLFYIFARALCWDQLRDMRQKQGMQSSQSGFAATSSARVAAENGWDCADYTFSKLSAPPSNPQTGPLFTSLYGLYPCNFLEFLRRPYSYFRENNFTVPEEFDEETFKTRTLTQVTRHMLHPNLVTMDTKTELEDGQRWKKMEPPDVIAQIMSLDLTNAASRVGFSSSGKKDGEQQPNLLFDETVFDSSSSASTSDSDEPEEKRPPTEVDSSSSSKPTVMQTILDIHRALKSGAEVLVGGDDVWDADLASLPPTGMSWGDTSLSAADQDETKLLIAGLKREVLLLRNELNFELFVKQQHLQHMGRLHHEHMIDSSVEAERQQMYNMTRMLRAQLKQATDALDKLKSESAMTKQKHIRWEDEQSRKLRGFREARKAWQVEMEALKQKLAEQETLLANQSSELLAAQKRAFELENELRTYQNKTSC